MLLLASASKARRNLLKQACIQHEVLNSGFDEASIREKEPKELALKLALAKAKASLYKINSEEKLRGISQKITSIIGCDSIFEFNGEIFGKPKSEMEAIERLRAMSSNSGILHTGHAFLFDKQSQEIISFKSQINEVVSTKINFVRLNQEEIENYVKTGEPLSCAGGFAIEGLGGFYIKSINGCFSNVIGLSLPWLRSALIKVNN